MDFLKLVYDSKDISKNWFKVITQAIYNEMFFIEKQSLAKKIRRSRIREKCE